MTALAELGGRYAAFVLPAYGVTLLCLVGLVIEAVVRGRRWKRAAEAERGD